MTRIANRSDDTGAAVRRFLGSAVSWVLAGLLLVTARAEDPYRIRPGDTLRIDVLNRPGYSLDGAVVRADGKLSYYVVGEIEAAGLTLEELRLHIQDGLRKHLAISEVVVSPIPRENDVYVGGQVASPGRYPFRDETITIRAALILAGGAVTEMANLESVTLMSKGGEPRSVDLTSPVEALIDVHRGDVVFVPQRTRIRVAGNVQQPGVFYVSGPVSVGNGLALAGGAVDDKGDLSRVVIVGARGDTRTIDLGPEFWADRPGDELSLGHGDTLYVPNTYEVEEVSVLGHIHAPGAYRVRGPVSVGRALALAGGAIMDEVDADRLEVHRRDGTRDAVRLADTTSDVLIFPGETLIVPKRFQINWSLTVSLISTAAVLMSLFRK